MEKSINFEINLEPSIVLNRTKTYFANLGFDLVRENSEELRFERGSILMNFLTFNPLKWKSTIQVSIREDKVKAEFDISTVGQAVTKKENQLWIDLIQNYHISVVDGIDFSKNTLEQLKSTKMNSMEFVRVAIVGALITGVPSIIVAILTGYYSIASMGAAAGAVGSVMKKLNEEATS